MQLFNTPTQKTQEDIENLGNGMDDLWAISNRIQQNYPGSSSSSGLAQQARNQDSLENFFEDEASLL